MDAETSHKLAKLAGTVTTMHGRNTLLVSPEQMQTLKAELPRCRNSEDELDLFKEVFGAAKALDLIQRFGHGGLNLRIMREVKESDVEPNCAPVKPDA